MIRLNKAKRGVSLIEMVAATGISAVVMASAVGLYVKGTSGFYNEQGRSYMQFRTRTVQDRIATEARGASAFLYSATIHGVTYTASTGPSPAACLILKVPSQDTYGLMYYGAGTTTPNAPVHDIVVYFYNASDKTLRRTVSPAINVTTSDEHSPRSSFRAAEMNAVVARNVHRFNLVLKDRNGALLTADAGARVASIDFQSQTLATGKASGESAVAVTAVRLRNMRSGSIPGCVRKNGEAAPGATVRAVFTSTMGAYPAGTIVATTYADSSGNFELYGLMEGTYSITATATDGTTGTLADVVVAQESAAAAVTVNLDPPV